MQAYDWGNSRLRDWSSQGKRTDFEEQNDIIERVASESVNLRDHLAAAQLGLEVSDSTDRMIGAYLIEMLDDAGYLIGDLLEVATYVPGLRLGTVEAVLDLYAAIRSSWNLCTQYNVVPYHQVAGM